MLIKKDSLLDYNPVISYVTLSNRVEAGLLKKMKNSLRHSSFIEMVHNTDRTKRELHFS